MRTWMGMNASPSSYFYLASPRPWPAHFADRRWELPRPAISFRYARLVADLAGELSQGADSLTRCSRFLDAKFFPDETTTSQLLIQKSEHGSRS